MHFSAFSVVRITTHFVMVSHICPYIFIAYYNENIFIVFLCVIYLNCTISNLYRRKISTFSVQRRNSGKKDANFFA